jgi:hypothetical protein
VDSDPGRPSPMVLDPRIENPNFYGRGRLDWHARRIGSIEGDRKWKPTRKYKRNDVFTYIQVKFGAHLDY